ncbi:MAG: hypothetical protein IAG13_17790 [Deltaproteobacteria bacterium]|nr:hypothetical protein [Nannocystaceae bacterium]
MTTMSSSTIRNASRWIHLVGAAWLGAFIYSPLVEVAAFRVATQFAVVPALTLTGLVLWKQAQLRNLLRTVLARHDRSRPAR